MEMNQELKNKIRRIINTYCQSSKGLSVGITNKDETIFEHYHGVINRYRTRNDRTKMIMVGSNTKLLTTFGIMQLVEKGLVDLDADIKEYLPELNVPSRFEPAPITIRLMLQHRSGLPGMHDRINVDMEKQSDLIQYLNESELVAKPGTMYAYSNNAFVLLGLIIERVSKMDYKEYIQKNIQSPLNTRFIFNDKDGVFEKHKDVFSRGFSTDGKEKTNELGRMIAAGSSTYGTIEDLMKLARVFLNPEEQTILKPNTVLEMMEDKAIDGVLPNDLYHNLSIIHNGVTFPEYGISTIGHGGATVYHSSLFNMIPELDIGIAVMSNTANTYFDLTKIQNTILTLLFEELGVPKVPLKEPSVLDVPTQYVGDYVAPFGFVKIRRYKDGNTYLKIGKANYSLVHDGEGYFKVVPVGNTKKFSKKSPFDKSTIKIREVDGKKVIHRRDYVKGGYIQSLTFADCRPTKQYKHWKKFEGTYKSTQNLPNNKSGLVTIQVNKLSIVVHFKWFGLPFYVQHYDYNETKLIIQGYGRHSGSAIHLYEEDNKKYLVVDGITYNKVQ